MRSMVLVALFVPAAIALAGASAHAEKVRCSAIRDSAMCISEPSCWYDAANNKGCVDGPRPDENPCAVHGSQSTCDISSLGCRWNADDSTCVTKAE